MPFAENLRYIMSYLNLTNYRLAKELGCSQTTISNYLDGTTTPRAKAQQKIAALFGLSVEDLMGDSIPCAQQLSLKKEEPAGQETDGREERFMELFSSLTEEKQDLVINLLEGLRDSGAAHLEGKEGTGETNQAP